MIRPVVSEDTSALIALAEASGLFEPEQLEEVGAMLANYVSGNSGSDQFWVTDDDGGNGQIGLAFCAPEAMTDGTWNLLLIAIHPSRRGQGRGAAMVSYVEQTLVERGGRVLLVETSGMEGFEKTRSFYRKCNYQEEARIRDYYKAGDDKIIFRKLLSA